MVLVFEILLAMIVAIIIGTISGITPGVHVNLICALIISSIAILITYTDPLVLCIFIVCLAITHSMLDTLPSTYLGAPSEENSLSLLPSQKMLLDGHGHEAVFLSVTGAYFGLLFAILATPIFFFIAKNIHSIIRPYLFYLMISLTLYLVLKEKEKFWCLFLLCLSGLLGFIVFSIKQIQDPLFPLLSGLFGVSGLLLSLFESITIPVQKKSDCNISFKDVSKTNLFATISVFLIQFFPGLGPAQGAVISSQIFKESKDKGYLVLVGSIGTMSVVFSLVTFHVLGKAKDGSIVAISKILNLDFGSFLILIICFFAAGSIAYILTILLSLKFSKIIPKINYKYLCISIIFFVVMLAFIFDGVLGFLVLLTSTAVGFIAPLKGIPRSHAMGCILIPVILYLAV